MLTLHNRLDKAILAFKLKTNQPRRYAVTPTQGVLGPGDNSSITITLEAGDIPQLLAQFASRENEEDKSLSSSDRFMILGTTLSSSEAAAAKEDASSLNSLWQARLPEQREAHKVSDVVVDGDGGGQSMVMVVMVAAVVLRWCKKHRDPPS